MPKPKIEGDDTVCENSVGFYKISPSLDPYKFKIKISVSGAKAHAINIYYDYAIINFKLPGLAQIKCIYTDQFGCTDSVIKQIYIKPSLFEFSAGPDITVCQGDSFIIGQPAIPGFTYIWNRSSDFADNYPLAVAPFVKSAQFKYCIKYGNGYWFRVIATDTNTGCSYLDTVVVIVNPRYKTNITGATDCVNDSTIYTYATDSMPNNAFWAIEGGKILSNPTAKSILVKWDRYGKNNLSLKYFTGSCKDSSTIYIGLSAIKQPFYAGPDVIVCNKDSVTLGMPPIPNCKYVWYDLRYIHLEWASQGSYLTTWANSPFKDRDFPVTYKVFIYDQITGCQFSDTVVLRIKPRIKSKVTANIGCYEDVATFTIDTLVQDGRWTVHGGKILSNDKSKSILVQWNKGGTNTVKYKYNFNGCTDSAYYTVDLDSLTYFPVSGADTIFENTTHTYSTKNIKNTNNNWQVSGGTIVSETDSTIAVLWGSSTSNAAIYNYKQNAEGCKSDTKILPITIKKRDKLDLSHTFYIYPNPFTNTIKIAAVNDFEGEIKIVLSDMPGRIISTNTAYIHNGKNALVWDFDAQNLKPGLYNISIITSQENTNWKMVKEQ